MGTETLAADTIVSKTNIAGTDSANLTEISADDTNDCDATANNLDILLWVGFPTPSGNVSSNTNTLTAVVKQFDTGQTGTPTAQVHLRENGSATNIVSSAVTDVPNTGDTSISINFTNADIATASGANVECAVEGFAVGGAPGARNTVSIDYIKWDVDYVDAGGDVLFANKTDAISQQQVTQTAAGLGGVLVE